MPVLCYRKTIHDYVCVTSPSGFSVSLSSDGRILAVGGRSDDSDIGAVWIFIYNGVAYQQHGSKLVGSGRVGASQQGKDTKLSYASC